TGLSARALPAPANSEMSRATAKPVAANDRRICISVSSLLSAGSGLLTSELLSEERGLDVAEAPANGAVCATRPAGHPPCQSPRAESNARYPRESARAHRARPSRSRLPGPRAIARVLRGGLRTARSDQAVPRRG